MHQYIYILKIAEDLLFHFHPNYSMEASLFVVESSLGDTIREQNQSLIVLNNQQMNQADN